MQVISPVNTAERAKMDVRTGDTVRVHQKIEEKGKTRTQVFEGLVLYRNHGSEAGATFTVRKVASGVGVEKTFPLYSPNITKIEVVARGRARRARLFYIRDKASKEAARKIRAIRYTSADVIADESKSQIDAEETQADANQTPELVSEPEKVGN